MAITAHVTQQKAGGNHSAVINREATGASPIGTAVWDPARAQFAFIPADHNVVLTAAEMTSIISILNGLSK